MFDRCSEGRVCSYYTCIIYMFTDSDPDICLIGVARVVSNQPIHELSPVTDTPMTWLTQHDMNGVIVFSDQRYTV